MVLMRRFSIGVLFIILVLVLAGCGQVGGETQQGLPLTGGTADPANCQPTRPDMLGPFYVSGAPERDKVGEGYVLSGTVHSAGDCAPLTNAQVELWMAGPDAEYADEYRAVVFSGENGEYRFESHFPPGYAGRPPHIHLRVTAQGYGELVTQHYPREGTTEAVFDLVLEGE
jgi:protocatechuate 3,4-dioxygenase beta subunit